MIALGGDAERSLKISVFFLTIKDYVHLKLKKKEYASKKLNIAKEPKSIKRCIPRVV